MEPSLANMGWKLYGLYNFSEKGLFNRPFVSLSKEDDKERIIEKLKESGFKNDDEMAIRFSKDNTMNLPFFLGTFSLADVAKIIQRERKNYTPFVHGLVRTKFSACLYYDGETIFLELWPGIGALKEKMSNENPDVIKINKNIHITRYLKEREVENINAKKIIAEPFDYNFLINFAKQIKSLQNKLDSLLKIQSPLLCDINCESLGDINFMGIQTTDSFDLSQLNKCIEDFYVAKSTKELEEYKGEKKLFLDIALSRNDEDLILIIKLLKGIKKVYTKSLTMHLSIILREFGINVERVFFNEDYEIKEFPISSHHI